jgi:ATP-dependent Zn protease
MALVEQREAPPATAASAPPSEPNELADSWARLTRAGTIVALLTSPLVYLWLSARNGWDTTTTLVVTFLCVIAFRGLLDLAARRFLPWPSLFGTESAGYKEADVVARRRAWFWRFWFRLAAFLVILVTIIWAFRSLTAPAGESVAWTGVLSDIWNGLGKLLKPSTLMGTGLQVFMLFFINFAILFGPLMAMGISQIKATEPGDANWGVKLDDVRGQAEPKEEVRRIVSLWQSGSHFEKAGGKRERGLLFLGAPGTGKTMLAKAIATGFNCPFIAIPGSGFAQTFIGMDAVIVRYLAWKAKKLARKWGGQCIVFIDEIDAVGMRRSALGGAQATPDLAALRPADVAFHGAWGAWTASGDLVAETAEWRDRLFEQRAAARRPPGSPVLRRVGGIANAVMPGMFGGGSLALNQLLVVMDGIGNPRFSRRFLSNRLNTFLDATYIVPRRVGRVPLRIRPAKPSDEQIYFIGATNAPIDALDPALMRPGRMGRHIWFRTPSKDDRKDIFDLYLKKVAHESDLDAPRRRDELGRITSGYSPAMIEQVCSMALTIAHHDGRERFGWTDLVDAMTTVESGTAINLEYIDSERRSIAIHEAGHAVCGHLFKADHESTRLSIKRRGGSGGHHAMRATDERFVQFRSEFVGDLVWGLGAMAAERIFYGENTSGVGGDVGSVTRLASLMVGAYGMLPERADLDGKFALQSEEDEARERIGKRFEAIGQQIMNRVTGGAMTGDILGAVLSDPMKKQQAARIIGQAYVLAHNTVLLNRAGVSAVADALEDRRELYGDEVIELLENLDLRRPEIDLTEERSWPKL